MALLIAVLLAVPLGMISAVYRYSALDYAATVTAFLGVSIPVFWLAMLLIIVFSVTLGWLPSAGMPPWACRFRSRDRLLHLVMPSLVLATFPLAQLMRYVRSSMVDALAQDYVRTARAKGLPEGMVLGRHALRNALIPMVTVLGVLTPRLLGGAVMTETIFAWPGLGRLAVEAAITRDYPVIMGATLAGVGARDPVEPDHRLPLRRDRPADRPAVSTTPRKDLAMDQTAVLDGVVARIAVAVRGV